MKDMLLAIRETGVALDGSTDALNQVASQEGSVRAAQGSRLQET